MPPHDQPRDERPGGVNVPVASGVDRSVDAVAPPPIVDWGRTARRLRLQLGVIAVSVVVAWVVVGLLRDALTLRLLAEVAGLGLLVAVLAEFAVVGGAALGGMLRAGERGERLSRPDVSLLPPQITCRRDRGC